MGMQGGGVKRLFRKVDDKSSQYDKDHPGTVRREGSYIYEEFLTTGNYAQEDLFRNQLPREKDHSKRYNPASYITLIDKSVYTICGHESLASHRRPVDCNKFTIHTKSICPFPA